MQNLVQKTSNLGNALKATSYLTAFPTTPAPLLIVPPHKVAVDPGKYYLSTNTMKSVLPCGNGLLRAVSGLTGGKYLIK